MSTTSQNPQWWEKAVAGVCSHGGHGYDGETCSDAPATVTRVWHTSSGKLYGADVTSAAGGKFTAYLDRGQVSWADPDVWAFPQQHGLVRWFCPGHGGAVCQYGACDEIRVTDLDWLRSQAEAFTS